jgi:hypothetical protein
VRTAGCHRCLRAASRVAGHRERVGQRRDERRVLRPVIEASTDQHHRRPVAVAGVCDRSSVLRLHMVHGASLRCRTTLIPAPNECAAGRGCARGRRRLEETEELMGADCGRR